jgi:hypothetical protein
MKLFPVVAVAVLVFAGTADAQRPQRQRPERERPPVLVANPVTECDEAAVLNPDGQVIFPAGVTDIETSVLVDEVRGSLTELYPDLDTTTDGFYSDLPCDPSIGGTLPSIPPPSQHEIDAEAFLDSALPGIIERLPRDPAPELRAMDAFAVAGCSVLRPQAAGRWSRMRCDDPSFLHSDQPFEGRDIIFVHGLEVQDLKDKIANPPGSGGPIHPANAVWPQDETEFLDPNGYFRLSAEHYWNNHLREHLFDPDSPANPNAGWQFSAADGAPRYRPKANRYLLIAWSSNQGLEYAQHALLWQIMLAMRDGRNVVTPPTYPGKSESRPFCANGCVIISHSTGSLIINTAMSRARSGHYGPGAKQVQRGVIAHVAFDGAISGSRLAEIGIAVALQGAQAVNEASLLCTIVDQVFGVGGSCKADMSFIPTSILRDLLPQVSQQVWGPVSNASPVPTVTFAGAAPLGNQAGGMTKVFLPGIDDGVETMNSACGNPNPVFPGVFGSAGVNPPSGMRVASLVKAFEFSEDPGVLARSLKNFMSQHNHLTLGIGVNDPRYLAGTCSPYLSPTGMVMLVEDAFGGTQRDARARFNNHYSFIQSLGEHSYDGGGDPANSWPSSISALPGATRRYWPYGTDNREESRVVTDGTIYTRTIDTNGTRLVKPVEMYETVRGRKVGFKLFGRRYTWWLWKRTYHLAHRWEAMQSSHYAYEFVARR